MVIIKLWLQISPDEQLRRFEDREGDPLKRWKLTDEDWRNRGQRAAYEDAVEEMLERTDMPLAPWDAIAAEQKRYGRLAVLEAVIRGMEAGNGALGHRRAALARRRLRPRLRPGHPCR